MMTRIIKLKFKTIGNAMKVATIQTPMKQIKNKFVIAFEDRFSSNTKRGIVYDPSALLFLEKVYEFLEEYLTLVDQYCTERDESETANKLKKTITGVKNELEQIFVGDNSVLIRLMSSTGARMHLKGTASDIDYGLMIKAAVFNKDKYGNMLIQNGYKFKKEIYGYYVYVKIVDGIEVEVKLREYEKSVEVMELHGRLDALPEKTQNKLAFAKALLFDDEELYGKFKWEIYSAYYIPH